MDVNLAATKIAAVHRGIAARRAQTTSIEQALRNDSFTWTGDEDKDAGVNSLAMLFLSGEAPQVPPHVLLPTQTFVLWWEGISDSRSL